MKRSELNTSKITYLKKARANVAHRWQRGVLLIELAFALPLLLIIFFNIIDWGIFLHNNASTNNATREAARWQVATLNNLSSYPTSVTTCNGGGKERQKLHALI